MSTRLTSNLRLRISDDLTADAVYNLERIDTVGSATSIQLDGDVDVRSIANIYLEPNSSSVGGTGSGGSISLGTVSHDVTSYVYGPININGALKLEDTASGGTPRYLTLQYKSDVSGSANTTADVILSLDLGEANRSVQLDGDVSLAGDFTTSGAYSIGLIATAATSVTLPTSGTLSTLANSETLTNKNVDADLNTITNIANDEIKSAAAIDGTKISPDFGTQNIITEGDFRLEDSGFYVGFSAPTLSASQVWSLPDADGTSSQVLSTNGAGALSWANVATDALPTQNVRVGNGSNVSADVDTSSVGDILADSTGGLTIKSGVIVDADINASAAIQVSKLEALTANRALVTDGSGNLTTSLVTDAEIGYLDGVTSLIQTQINSKLTVSANLGDVPDAATSRGNLGVAIGSDVQAYDAGLDDISGLTPTLDNVIVGDGSNWGQAALSSLGGLQQQVTTWADADGNSKVISHSYGNVNVMVQIFDDSGIQVFVDSVTQTDANTLTLARSAGNGGDWTVLIKETT